MRKSDVNIVIDLFLSIDKTCFCRTIAKSLYMYSMFTNVKNIFFYFAYFPIIIIIIIILFP